MRHKNYNRRKNYPYTSKDNKPLTLEDKVRLLDFQIPKTPPEKPKIEEFRLTEKAFNGYEKNPKRAERHRKYDIGCLPLFISWAALGVIWWIISGSCSYQVERIVFLSCFGLGFLTMFIYASFRESYNKVNAYDSYKSSLKRYEEDCNKYYSLLKQKEEAENAIRDKAQALKGFIDGIEGSRFLQSFSEELKLFDVFKYRTENTWRNMTPREFEYGVSDVYARLGYLVSVTKESSDGGVDVILTKDSHTTYVQCKHYAETTPVHVHEVREFFGVCMQEQLNGIFVHTSSLTPSAQQFVSTPGVKKYLQIVSLDQLMRLERNGGAALLELNSETSSSLRFQRDVINNQSFVDCRYYWLFNRLFDSMNSASLTMKSLQVWKEMQYAIVSDTSELVESQVYLIVLGSKEAIRQLSRWKTVHELYPDYCP